MCPPIGVKDNPESKIIVFVRTRIRAQRVAKAMERVGIASLAIHGDKEQGKRIEVMEQFREGKRNLLIATDISARGINVPDIKYVINYDLPIKTENYVHRVGRTGRGFNKGVAISFCSNEEIELLDDIQKFLDKKIEVIKVHKEDYAVVIDPNNYEDKWKRLIEEEENRRAKAKKKSKKGVKS